MISERRSLEGGVNLEMFIVSEIGIFPLRSVEGYIKKVADFVKVCFCRFMLIGYL